MLEPGLINRMSWRTGVRFPPSAESENESIAVECQLQFFCLTQQQPLAVFHRP